MLGQPVTMLIPQVIGFRLSGQAAARRHRDRSRAHRHRDAAQEGRGGQVRRVLRRRTCEPAARRPRDDCQHGAGIRQHLRHLPDRRRDASAISSSRAAPSERIELVDAPTPRRRACGATRATRPRRYTDVLELDLGKVEPSLAGPRRPQDRVPLKTAKTRLRSQRARRPPSERATQDTCREGHGRASLLDGQKFELKDGAVLIAAITSCTNTSNPSVMLGAGLLARKAREHGLKAKPWVKTSLAPGSRVVTDYFTKAGVLDDLAAVGFDVVGYGCTTCIGNSGPLKPEISAGVKAGDLIACCRAFGQPQFRRSRAPRSAHELPGLAAAGGGVRARRHAGYRPRRRSRSARQGRQARIPRRHLAERHGSAGGAAAGHRLARCSARAMRACFTGDANWTSIKVPGR